MVTNYDGKHAIIFMPVDNSEGVQTWADWFLIPTSRPTVSIPTPRTKFVEIPGMNGSYDLSTYLNNEVTYSDRTGSFEFIIAPDRTDWITASANVMSYLHGQQRHMMLTDDMGWFYTGRFSFDSLKSDPKTSKIVISYRLAPFKISYGAAYDGEIEWDPFNFARDIDWSLYNIITLNNEDKQIDIWSIGARNILTVAMREDEYHAGDSVVATLFGEVGGKAFSRVQTVHSPGQEVNFALSNDYSHLILSLKGTGTLRTGWHRISL